MKRAADAGILVLLAALPGRGQDSRLVVEMGERLERSAYWRVLRDCQR